jgi:LmbE family N-acetylglucosaminyl deacetylase/SAM-dependent methyltransferase
MTPPTFSRIEPGTLPETWRPVVDHCPVLALPPMETPIVVLAAHPDDETLGAGGVIASAAAGGHRIVVVIASDGEAAYPGSGTHPAEQLGRTRRAEAISAVSTLAPEAELHFMGLPDGRLGEEIDALQAFLSAVVLGGAWLFTPWFHDRHPDHRACSAAARRVAACTSNVRLLEYPIWAWHWASPDRDDLPLAGLRRIPIDAAAEATRRQALAAYVSQTTRQSGQAEDEPVLSAAFVTHFLRPYDVVLDRPPAAATEYFDAVYASADDPWELAERWYERRKRQVLLASLPRARFRRVFEPGCATGLITAQLAERSEAVVAVDAAARAVEIASSSLSDLPHVAVSQLRIPEQWPEGRFDLVVLSEIAYYCRDLRRLAARLRDSLTADGVVVLCHWRHDAVDHPWDAETVHACLPLLAGLHRQVQHLEADFRLDVLTVDIASIAQQEGIVA